MHACRFTPRSAQDYQVAVVGRSSRLSFELVSPSGREQQGLGPGQEAVGGPATSGVPPPSLSQKKMQLQPHMSTPNVGCVLLLKRAGGLGSMMGASWHIALLCMPDLPGISGGVPAQVDNNMGSGTIPVRRGRFDPSGSHSQELQVETQAAVLRNGGARESLAVEGSWWDKL